MGEVQNQKMTIKEVIERTAEKTAEKTLKKLRSTGRVTYFFSNSFKKTEEVLYLYPKLPDDNPEKQRIDLALEKIKDSDYKDVIASKYFDGLTISEIADIYNCKYQTISKHRNKLIKIIASELFPEDVLAEIINR